MSCSKLCIMVYVISEIMYSYIICMQCFCLSMISYFHMNQVLMYSTCTGLYNQLKFHNGEIII